MYWAIAEENIALFPLGSNGTVQSGLEWNCQLMWAFPLNGGHLAAHFFRLAVVWEKIVGLKKNTATLFYRNDLPSIKGLQW